MRARYAACLIAGMWLGVGWVMVGMAQNPTGHVPDSDVPYVQVSAVNVQPTVIHRIDKPDATTVIVQIVAVGRVPADSTARVALGTYSTDPPGMNIEYDPPQTVSLKESPAVAKFEARSGPQTRSGKLVVAASVSSATNGVKVKPPQDPKDWTATLTIVEP